MLQCLSLSRSISPLLPLFLSFSLSLHVRFKDKLWIIIASYHPSPDERLYRFLKACVFLSGLWYPCCENRERTSKHKHYISCFVPVTSTHEKERIILSVYLPTQAYIRMGNTLCLSCGCQCVLCVLNSPFLSPKKRVCCAGFDHWREVLSLYSTRQVRFAVPPCVTVTFWTRGYWPLIPATWHNKKEEMKMNRERERQK